MGNIAEATSLVSEQSLQLLQSVNSFVSIPGVGDAAEAALSILSLVQTVKSNKVDFQSVGEKACTIMVTIVQKVNAAEQPNHRTNMSSLQKDCDTLRRSIETVKRIVDKHLKGRRRFVLWKRVLYLRLDQAVIKDCKQRLQDALDLFSVQSHIEMRSGVDNINTKLDNLAKNPGQGSGPKITQHAGRNAYSHTMDNSVRVGGTGNNVNVSTVAPSPTYYHPGHYY